MTVNRDLTLWSMLPHTHVRGKRWSYEATYPDGRKEALLSVPQYDFEWQTDYIFKQPGEAAQGHHAPRHGVVRQLPEQQVEPRCRRRKSGGAIRRGKR